jgi:cell division protein FtsQ
MPPGVRGGSLAQAKPRPKANAKPRSARPRRTKAVEYAPAKLRAAQAIGMSPAFASGVAAAVVIAAVGVALATGGRWDSLKTGMTQSFGHQAAMVGFKLAAVHVEGASPMARDDILRASGLTKDQPLLGLSLSDLRGRIEQVGWVKEAKVIRLLPDTLVIAVKERPTMAVWQNRGKLHVIDGDGRPIPEADPGRFPNLPLVVGEGANQAVADLWPLIRARPRVAERLEALVRVDNRRWDLRLKDGSIIQLPAIGMEPALIRLDQLDQGQRILELGFQRIDLREADLVAVRPRAAQPAVLPTAAAPAADPASVQHVATTQTGAPGTT